MLSQVALALNVLCYIGMQLVWFQGDKTGVQLPYFCLFVANFFFTSSITNARESRVSSGLFRTIGTFFLLQNVELAICSLPPVAMFTFDGMIQRRDTTNAGGVVVLIVVFASFVGSFTHGFKLPVIRAGRGNNSKTLFDRLVSVRGAAFLIASVFFIIAEIIQWSWSSQCNANGRQAIRLWYPVTNATLLIIAVIFVIAVIYGDDDTQNISIFLAATLLFSGSADPLFDNKVEWRSQEPTSVNDEALRFFKRWRAAKGLSFIGVVLLLLSVIVTSARKKFTVSALVAYDVAVLGIAITGAVCVWARNPDSALPVGMTPAPNTTNNFGPQVNLDEQYIKAYRDYSAAFAIVITALNLLQQFLGIESGTLISTFFSIAVLKTFDEGSAAAQTGYLRGGLQLCQVSVIASVFLKAFPVDKPILSYIKIDNVYGTGFGALWVLLAMLFVPNNYSATLIIAIISYKSVTTGSLDWGRTTFHILAWYGIVQVFPLTGNAQLNLVEYRASAYWFASVVFAVRFSTTAGGTAPSLDNPNNNPTLPDSAASDAEEREVQPNEPTEDNGQTGFNFNRVAGGTSQERPSVEMRNVRSPSPSEKYVD